MMDHNALYHHGVKGMKWGVRRFQNKDGTRIGNVRKKLNETDTKNQQSTPQASKSAPRRTIKDLSDAELKEKISRLELEKRYRDLTKTDARTKISRGKAFAYDVLEKSGKNIATQALTYVMGQTVNKAFGDTVVNPKKGQKDK